MRVDSILTALKPKGPTLEEAFAAGRAAGNSFDAIRLGAALMVLYAHAWYVATGANPTDFIERFSHGQTGMGDLGIGIFFVLSGFLIAESWSRAPHVGVYAKNRALRILPALAVVVTATTVAVGPVFTRLPLADYYSAAETWAYLSNAIFFYWNDALPGVFEASAAKPAANGPLWTLHFEAVCYGAVALLGSLRILTVRGCLWVFGVLLIILIAVGSEVTSHAENYARQLATMGSWFFGGVVFSVAKDRIRLDGRYAAGAFVLLLATGAANAGFDQAFAIAGAYLALWLGFADLGPLRRVGEAGDFSYGLYIWSWPIQQAAALHLVDGSPLGTLAVSLPTAFLCAWASWRFVEAPALKLKTRSLAAHRFARA